MNRRRCLLMFALWVCGVAAPAGASEWQWSTAVDEGRAFLWIPPGCEYVRGVIVGQHNMSEEGVLEHPTIRAQLGALGMAAVWVAPPFDPVFDFTRGAGARFETMMRSLAEDSGYSELASAPVIPIGHSACASYPWNFAAWNPGRTLAAISLHGDAPLTNMTGSGRPNPDWGERTLDGVPGLMMMAEYEWLEGRLAPALAYRREHPDTPLAILAEPGTGHFDVSEEAIDFLAMFIRKAAKARLPLEAGGPLTPVSPATGWLVQRWRVDQARTVEPAPVQNYRGDPGEAFWAFDREMAEATHRFRAGQIGRKPQLLGFIQNGWEGVVPQTPTHQQVNLRYETFSVGDPLAFGVHGVFLDKVDGGSPNTTRWTGLPAGARLEHAVDGGPVRISRITGPAVQVGPESFRIQPNRTWSTHDNRKRDIWLLASHEGDDGFKSARQQALLKIPENREGVEQRISFPEIANQPLGTPSITLVAESDREGPVGFYVREGPAYVDHGRLHFTAIPPRAKFPVRITVVAWQLGRATEPKVREAELVERTFYLVKP